jgi:8-O-methyltransferase
MTPAALRQLAFSFRAARALQAGVELGLFEALHAGHATPAELASARGCDARALGIWLEALAALGVLERRGCAYRICAQLRGTLLPGGDAYLGNLFLHDLWHWSRWARLDETLRSGAPRQGVEGDRYLGDPGVLGRFLPNYNAAMEQSADGAPARLADAIAEHAPARVVDLGGGTGALLSEVCARLPEARGWLVEHGFALAGARERLADDPASARIALVERDFETGPIPPADAIALSRVLMGFAPERAHAAVLRAAAALAPGGRLYVHDFDARSRVGALLGLDMLLNTGGQVHSARAIRGWLVEAGLVELEERELLPYTRLWSGRKPPAPRAAQRAGGRRRKGT